MICSLEKISAALLTLFISAQQEYIMWLKRSDGIDSFMYLKT